MRSTGCLRLNKKASAASGAPSLGIIKLEWKKPFTWSESILSGALLHSLSILCRLLSQYALNSTRNVFPPALPMIDKLRIQNVVKIDALSKNTVVWRLTNVTKEYIVVG